MISPSFLMASPLAHVYAHRGEELEGATASGSLGVAVAADLLAQLIDEDAQRVRLGERPGQLAQRLGHETGLQADGGVPYLPFDLGLGNQGRHRVDDHDVDGARTHEHIADFQSLLAVVRLGNQHVVDVDAQARRVHGIERMLGIDEGDDAAERLGLGDDLQRQRCLAAGLRTVDFDDTAPGDAADAQSCIERERAGGNGVDDEIVVGISVLHDGAFAELGLDRVRGHSDELIFCLCHRLRLPGSLQHLVRDYRTPVCMSRSFFP